ncbi:PorT family protein [Prevotella sp. E13-17]|uniref:outer membrane beta-barrel protein n=1 Tax=Prevotella sp. E13-17 TaxID=2913616 RepID=UPI001EDA8EBF|nr:outer membrane beta-barrel protein [Prevotella sp. E13-17]UKK51784.1 PorT family protein [Prevotella sp. E13-17]
MKKIFAAIVAVLFAAPSFAQMGSGGFSLNESTVYYGIRMGVNFSTITGDLVDVDSKAGMTLGGVIGLRVSDTTPIFVESGLYYSARGAKDFNLNYLEIPVLIKYGIQATDDIAILPYIGPYFSYGIGGKYKFAGIDGKHSSYNIVKHPDMGFKLGCGAEYNKLYAELGYQFGVMDIAKDNDLDAGAHTGNFFINVGVNF